MTGLTLYDTAMARRAARMSLVIKTLRRRAQ
jgi:hypothetical protein